MIRHDFELHMAMINSHAHLRIKMCLCLFINFRQNLVDFRQIPTNVTKIKR